MRADARHVSPVLFPWAVLAGAALLALWLAGRFSALAPRTALGLGVRVVLAVASLAVTAPAFGAVRAIVGGPAALLLVTLPSGVLVVLAVTWLLTWVGRATPPPSH
jgi:hypothetical protein